jgi:hypothetical protein
MKFSVALKKTFTAACIYYAVISLALLLLQAIANGGFHSTAVGTLNFLLIFPFSLSISVAQAIHLHASFSAAARRLLHYLIFTLAFFLFLWLPSLNADSKPMNSLIVLLLFSVLYWLVALIVSVTKKRFHSFREE